MHRLLHWFTYYLALEKKKKVKKKIRGKTRTRQNIRSFNHGCSQGIKRGLLQSKSKGESIINQNYHSFIEFQLLTTAFLYIEHVDIPIHTGIGIWIAKNTNLHIG